MSAVEIAEADAARVFSRALVLELQQDPDFEVRDRLLNQARLKASAVLRRSRASPERVMTALAKLDELVRPPVAYASRSGDWAERQRNDQKQRAGPKELSEAEKLQRELDSHVVPGNIEDISRLLGHYDTRVTRREHSDQTF
jgi:hypothetical protein